MRAIKKLEPNAADKDKWKGIQKVTTREECDFWWPIIKIPKINTRHRSISHLIENGIHTSTVPSQSHFSQLPWTLEKKEMFKRSKNTTEFIQVTEGLLSQIKSKPPQIFDICKTNPTYNIEFIVLHRGKQNKSSHLNPPLVSYPFRC